MHALAGVHTRFVQKLSLTYYTHNCTDARQRVSTLRTRLCVYTVLHV